MARLKHICSLEKLLCLATLLFAVLFDSTAAAQPYRPELKIVASNETVAVSWPLAAYYYALVTNRNLESPVLWGGAATASKDFSSPWQYGLGLGSNLKVVTNVVGEEVVFNATPTNAQMFYGMVPARIPICQFAVFYDGLLEFSTAPTLVFNGPIHANGDIYTGTSTEHLFYKTVTTCGSISSPAWNGHGPDWTNTGTFSAAVPFVTNVAPLKVLMGTNALSLHVMTNLHGLIEMPPLGEDPNSEMGRTRYYNYAQVVLLVSNTTVSVRIQVPPDANMPPGADPAPIILVTNLTGATNFPFLTVTNTFTDQREHKLVKTTQIDLGKYKIWLSTNSLLLGKFPVGSYPTILYVADNRTNTSATMTAIRITNGISILNYGSLGFTLATPNPLYVWGNYNCTNASYLYTTNTAAAAPSALICDALTILSSAWKDSASVLTYSSRTASAATTVNAAFITGNVSSTGSNTNEFSGGVQNLPRLLEDWGASSLWLNTSFICLYQSIIATNQLVWPGTPGMYYNPPSRKFSFDQNFASPAKLPPGTPFVGVPSD